MSRSFERGLPSIGSRLDQSRKGDAVAIAVGVLLFLLVGVVGVGIHGAYQGQLRRVEARSPVPAASTAEAAVLFGNSFDEVDHQYVDVFVARPLRPDAPLPPGLVRWPGPGEVIMSPALARMNGTSPDPLYLGRLVGLVGLATPDERIAYVNPPATAALSNRLTPVRGFGSNERGWGPQDRVLPEGFFLAAYGILLVVPAFALIIAATSLDGGRRRRQADLVRLLGATSWQRAQLRFAWGVMPVLAGATVAAALTCIAANLNFPIVGTNFDYTGHDLADQWPMLILVLTASTLAAGALAVRAPRRETSAKSIRGARPILGAIASLVCVGLVVAALPVAEMLAEEFPGMGIADLFLGGSIVGICLLLPILTAWVISQLSTRGFTFLRRSRYPSMIVALAALRGSRLPVARAVSVLSGTFFVLILAMGYFRLFAAPVPGSAEIYRHNTAHIATANLPNNPTTSQAVLNQLLRLQVAIVVVTFPYEQSPGEPPVPVYYANAQGRKLLNDHPIDKHHCQLTIPNPLLRSQLVGFEQGCVRSWAALTPRQSSGANVVILDPAGHLSLRRLQWQAYQILAVPPEFITPGESSLEGSEVTASESLWRRWMTFIGLLLVAPTLGLFQADDIRRTAHRIAPLSALGMSRGLGPKVMAIRVALPAGVAILVSGFFSARLVQFMNSPMFGEGIGTGWLAPYLILAFTLIVAQWAISSLYASRTIKAWTSGKDRE